MKVNYPDAVTGGCMSADNNYGTAKCQSAFLGKYKFNTDSMAGGVGGVWGPNRYTLYHPNSFRVAQDFLEDKAMCMGSLIHFFL